MKKSPYLTAEETAALIAEPVVVDWERKARTLMDVIDAAWNEMPGDLRAMRADGCELAGAVRALFSRAAP